MKVRNENLNNFISFQILKQKKKFFFSSFFFYFFIDKNGSVSKEEFKKASMKRGELIPFSSKLFEEIDQNQDNSISFEGFFNF